jgi:hypothetical protein
MKLPMHRAPRCGARTRRGSPCQSPAMKNGRCRMHGGTAPGPPKGNKNALKHGRDTANASLIQVAWALHRGRKSLIIHIVTVWRLMCLDVSFYPSSDICRDIERD